MRPLIWMALALGGCSYGYNTIDNGVLWDPSSAVASADGLYVTMPLTGGLVRLSPGDAPSYVDLGAARVRRVEASEDGTTVLATTVAVRCEDASAQMVRDCAGEDRVNVGALAVLASSEGERTLDVPAWYGGFTFSEDGRYAVASFDPDADTSGGGVVNLTSVLVVDLQTGQRWEVGVGFQASRVLFTDDGAGATVGMVVLSQSEVAVVDLTTGLPTRTATYPLALDADVTIQPLDVALTPDDRYALITVQGSADLYVLDLVDPSINIVSLAGAPADMVVDTAHDRTLFVYANRPMVELLDHDLFDLTSLSLDEGATAIYMAADYALLSAPNRSRDVVRLDLGTLRRDEYRLNFLPSRLEVSPDESFALTFSEEQGGGRLEVLDLRRIDGRVDDDPKPFQLDGPAVGTAFADTGDGQQVLLLQRGVETLYTLGWPSLQVEAIRLPAPPLGVGVLPDGPFWITHAAPLGLVSFWTPGSDLTSVGDFAHVGALDDTPLWEEN